MRSFLHFSSQALIGSRGGRSSFTCLGGDGFLDFSDLNLLFDSPNYPTAVVIYLLSAFQDPIETGTGSMSMEAANFLPGDAWNIFRLDEPLLFMILGELCIDSFDADRDPSPPV